MHRTCFGTEPQISSLPWASQRDTGWVVNAGSSGRPYEEISRYYLLITVVCPRSRSLCAPLYPHTHLERLNHPVQFWLPAPRYTHTFACVHVRTCSYQLTSERVGGVSAHGPVTEVDIAIRVRQSPDEPNPHLLRRGENPVHGDQNVRRSFVPL
jgi:hypothetical protein